MPCWSSWNDGDVELGLQALLDLEAARGRDVLEVDAAETGGDRLDGGDDLVGVLGREPIGNASTSPNSLKSIALPSITGSAASGPMLPRPSTAEPSVTTATMCCFVVSDHTFSGVSAIAWETRATPGVYAIERSSRVFTGDRGTTSIFPPRCIRKVRSETWRTSTPSTCRTFSTTWSRWAASAARMVTSRTLVPFSTRTMSIAPSDAPASPMAAASRANEPGESSSRVRIVALNEADGCMPRT